MSAKDRLADAMREHEIEVDHRMIGETVDDDGWDHVEHRFRLDIGGEMILENARYRAGLAVGDIDAADIFGSLLADCASVEPWATTDGELPDDAWLDWAEEYGLFDQGADALRRARSSFREIRARRSLLIERLGGTVYAELVDIAAGLLAR